MEGKQLGLQGAWCKEEGQREEERVGAGEVGGV